MKTSGKSIPILLRLRALLLAAALVLTCAACGASDEEEDDGGARQAQTEHQGGGSESGGAPGLTMTVNRDTGKLSVRRMPLSSGAGAGSGGRWTIFVYLCGTNLESDGAGATGDLLEMLDGADGDGVRYVVETGGANEWQNNTVEAGVLQRYLVSDGDIELVDQQRNASMGKSETLADFLSWGVEQYASEHMGVVLWNHGGGSITGVCFDETAHDDSLSLRELDAAFHTACTSMGRKFDFAGFDACLMGTLETANILATYADYMIASQELEPGSGWDYSAIGKYLDKNPGADTVELGTAVCDSYLESCREADDDDLCTLSVIDLSKLDELLVAFNDFSRGMYEAAGDSSDCAAMIRSIGKAENFGGNNKSEGYTNMVDVGGLISACESYAGGAQAAREALANTVAYSISGSGHRSASGLSMYYPLSIQGSQELTIFSDVCPSPYYISFVDRQSRSGAGEAEDYDDGTWFDEDGDWFWGLFGGWLDEDSGESYDSSDYYDYDEYYEYDDYWNHVDGYEETGESPYITFAAEPQLDEDGSYWFALDDDGYDAAADVYGLVFELSEDGEDLIELGQTYDINADWERGVFADDFDGWWISLPDGQNLATCIVEDAEDYTIYTSPILLNGEETNLRLKLDYTDGTMKIEGAWDGLSENGAASRDLIKLRSGDVITPLYNAFALESEDEFYYYGAEYTFSGTPEIYYDIMEDGDYFYAFCIDDIYGDYYMTDFVSFTVEDGEVWFSEE